MVAERGQIHSTRDRRWGLVLAGNPDGVLTPKIGTIWGMREQRAYCLIGVARRVLRHEPTCRDDVGLRVGLREVSDERQRCHAPDFIQDGVGCARPSSERGGVPAPLVAEVNPIRRNALDALDKGDGAEVIVREDVGAFVPAGMEHDPLPAKREVGIAIEAAVKEIMEGREGDGDSQQAQAVAGFKDEDVNGIADVSANAKVYALFNLAPDEVALLEASI